ncbi:lytic transglycosylase domain-containing protein [Nostoc sp. 3335mG]|nr:lytic transglycosylase domain-containing protein [Nostoc sp. 3335mG]
MAPLIRLGFVLSALSAAASVAVAQAPRLGPWQPMITEASLRFGVPQTWIERVILAESGGHTTLAGHLIRSRTGAMGLMQLMPATWADMRDAWHLGSDPDDPHDNITAGTAYLRAMYDRFGYPGLFAAYNAGPQRYATAIAMGARLPDETLAYLATVTGTPKTLPPAKRAAAMQTLFVVRAGNEESSTFDANSPPGDALFAVRGGAPPKP